MFNIDKLIERLENIDKKVSLSLNMNLKDFQQNEQYANSKIDETKILFTIEFDEIDVVDVFIFFLFQSCSYLRYQQSRFFLFVVNQL